MAVPALTDDERRAALRRAQQVRTVRAETKRALADGTLSFEAVLDRAADDEIVAGMRCCDVLEAVPGIGTTRARRLMEQNRIASGRRLRGLGHRQIAALRDALSPAGRLAMLQIEQGVTPTTEERPDATVDLRDGTVAADGEATLAPERVDLPLTADLAP